jgi:hypothetical protein
LESMTERGFRVTWTTGQSSTSGQISTKTSSPSTSTGKVWVPVAQGVSW